MTEQEWLTCDDPQPMLFALQRASIDFGPLERQIRLFCVACCRLIWDDVLERVHRDAVEEGEAFALGQLSQVELSRTRNDLYPNQGWPRDGRRVAYIEPVYGAIAPDARSSGYMSVKDWLMGSANSARSTIIHIWGSRRAGPAPPDAAPPTHPWHRAFQAGVDEVNLLMADYLVCLMGNPFRPSPIFDPSWRSSTAVGLAEGIDADRAYDRMPILADALEDAGCDDASVLSHCRGAANHTRGCWVVEQVVNRTRR